MFQYGQEVLEKVSQPSYSFTVDSADFLVMDEFEAFKNALSLGKRVYLKLDNGRVLTPLLLGFSHTFDEKSGLTLEFSNKFTSNDENDRLVDLLEQSVSMGKKLDLSREINAFTQSHANTAIHDFMNGAFDVAKNAILSTTGQAISWDENGLRLRKWNSDRTGYEDEQVWMKDNLIVFTEDAWQHAKMAIGHIHDEELGDLWGVIADSIVGKLLAGENLIIVGTDTMGKKTLFRVDGSGMYAYNSRFWMESTNGGAFAIDPSFGLGLGQSNPFVVGSDGTIVPKCIDPQTGELKLDKDGFPAGMNFWAGMDGQVFVRGHLVMESGEAHGDFYANNFYFNDGDDVKTLISKAGVDFSKMKRIDLGGIVLDGETGNINFTSAGSITWGNNAPVKYQFSTSLSGPWHDTMQANDKYRRDSLDGGTTWGSAYQFKGTDGRPGSDANVPEYITENYIGPTEIRSPTIKANDYYIYPYDEKDYTGSFNIFGMFSGSSSEHHMLRIEYDGHGDIPNVLMFSPASSPICIGRGTDPISLEGNLDFSSANRILWGKNAPTAVFG